MTMLDGNDPAVAWEVVTTAPGVGPNVTGQNVPGHLVTARLLANGAVFQVFIPNTDIGSVEKVKSDIHARAVQLAAISNLKSG